MVRFYSTIARRFREESRKTQDEVALACGVKSQAVSNWERGLNQPRAVHVRTMARLYACYVSDIADLSSPDRVEEGAAEAVTPEEESELEMLLKSCPQSLREICETWQYLDEPAKAGLRVVLDALAVKTKEARALAEAAAGALAK